MLTHSDILKLREWSERNNTKVVFKFKDYPYRLVIEKMIKSQDRDGRTVEWTRAFGTKRPHQVIASLPIEEIVIIYKNTGEEEKVNLKQLLKKIS
ncbi:MAG: hypothetical protein DRJ38_02250 [Thermoprotei archaeon]|nr:MAG: hypothetical protein DRJ38_02250 [Thermoprotei archaeon]